MIEDNIINDMKCWTKEIPGVIIDGKVQNDARGAVFQIQDTFTGNPIAMDATGNYVGNPVANMQLFVAEQIKNGNLPVDDVLQTGVNTISDELLAWARDGGQLNPYYRCNGDVMFHVGKGIVVIRVEDTINFMIRNNVSSSLASAADELEESIVLQNDLPAAYLYLTEHLFADYFKYYKSKRGTIFGL